MNALEETLKAAASWVAWTSLAASVLAILVWVVQLCLARALSARWAYGLWFLVFLRLVIPFTPSSDLSLFNLMSRPRADAVVPVVQPAPMLLEPVGPTEPDPTVVHPQPFPGTPASVWWPRFWLAGALLFWLVVWGQHRRLVRRLRLEPPTAGPIAGLVEELRQRMGLSPRLSVLVTDRVSTPALLGWWRPRLLLPRSQLADWSLAEIGWVVRHELAHVRRQDVLLNWAMILVQALHWFNPLVWWAFRRLRAARELACDEAALEGLPEPDRQSYGAALIRLLERNVEPSHPQLLVPILSHKNELKRRITMIAQSHSPRYAWLVGLLACLGLACLTFTRAADKPPAAAPAAAEPEQAGSQNTSEAEKALLGLLEEQLDVMDVRIAEQEAIKARLLVRLGSPERSTQRLEQFERQQYEAAMEANQARLLLAQLKKLSRADLLRAAPTLVPDASLQKLLDKQVETEQRLEEMMSDYAETHPEVRKTRVALERVNRQIEGRLEGILLGLETKLDLAATRNKDLTSELERLQQLQLEEIVEQQPLLRRLERELQILQEVRDRLAKRVLEEKINSKLPPAGRLGRSASDSTADDRSD